MKRPEDIRTPPKDWVKVLRVAYPFLRNKEKVGDLVLFGSQALSIYMKSPLRSKDLDLLSEQIGPPEVERLSRELAVLEDVEIKTTTIQTRMFGPRKMTTYGLELRVRGKPFFVELFDRILDGQPPSMLQPYVEPVRRWNLEVWAPDLEATMALRLSFRQPEGISRFNATRLNSFVRENRNSLRFNRVASILKNWKMEVLVEKNLVDLYRRNGLRIIGDNKILPGIDKKLKQRSVD
jgi:predicted nucleotidyltransferase